MSQANKRARIDRTPKDEEGYEPTSSQSRKTTVASQSRLDSESTNRLVKEVIRYCMACEFKKIIIRKDDINKKVLHEYSRQFNIIFKEVKEQILDTFGMALVEIPAKEVKGKNKPAAASGGASQQPIPSAKAAPSHCYILYNYLNKDRQANKVIHQTEEDYASMGLLYYMLSVLLINEQELQERELLSYLATAGLDGPSDTFGDMDKMLALYVKQGYLHCFKEAMEEQPTYQWGPRAKSEISYKDLAEFMSSICEPEDEDTFKNAIFKSAGF